MNTTALPFWKKVLGLLFPKISLGSFYFERECFLQVWKGKAPPTLGFWAAVFHSGGQRCPCRKWFPAQITGVKSGKQGGDPIFLKTNSDPRWLSGDLRLSNSSIFGLTFLHSWMRSWSLVSTSFFLSENIHVQIHYCLVQEGCLPLIISHKKLKIVVLPAA